MEYCTAYITMHKCLYSSTFNLPTGSQFFMMHVHCKATLSLLYVFGITENT